MKPQAIEKVAPLKKKEQETNRQKKHCTTKKRTTKNLKIHTEVFKTTKKERNINIQEFCKTEIITSMTVNYTSGKPNEISQTEN